MTEQAKSEQVCGSCRFWSAPSPEADVLRLVQIDGRDNEVFGCCECPKFRRGYGESPAAPDEIVIEDDEGWGFYTGPHFGCIHWAQRQLG